MVSYPSRRSERCGRGLAPSRPCAGSSGGSSAGPSSWCACPFRDTVLVKQMLPKNFTGDAKFHPGAPAHHEIDGNACDLVTLPDPILVHTLRRRY